MKKSNVEIKSTLLGKNESDHSDLENSSNNLLTSGKSKIPKLPPIGQLNKVNPERTVTMEPHTIFEEDDKGLLPPKKSNTMADPLTSGGLTSPVATPSKSIDDLIKSL